ncbi:MAG: hypothetical protein JNK27_16865 [Chitinophagaceae bacterium]|nr:hypothetical protein [Chitinophagaceae bacterium]
MKHILILSVLSTLILSNSDCSKKTTAYKGRLEVKGLCMNYTISVLQGNIDPSLILSDWTDETTGKQYKNVFKLGSPCNFPSTINQGDEFYFTIDTSTVQNCAVCMAFYPTPSKALAIKVVNP